MNDKLNDKDTNMLVELSNKELANQFNYRSGYRGSDGLSNKNKPKTKSKLQLGGGYKS